MAFCTKCGNELKGKIKFCPECGNNVESILNKKKKDDDKELVDNVKQSIEKVLDTEDTTKKFTKKDRDENMAMAILCYIGVLVFIPFFAEKKSKYVRYHAVQGMNLLIAWGVYSVAFGLLSFIKVTKPIVSFGYTIGTYKVAPWWIELPSTLVSLSLIAISIVGIVNVCKGKAKELPIIGKLKIVK